MREDEFQKVPTREDAEDARVVPIPKAQQLLGGVTYRQITLMVQRGDLVKLKIGRRTMIYRKSIDRYIDRQLAEAEQVAA